MKAKRTFKKIIGFVLCLCLIGSIVSFGNGTGSSVAASLGVPSLESGITLDTQDGETAFEDYVDEEESPKVEVVYVPMDLAVVQSGATAVTLTWHADSAAAVYKVCRAYSENGNYSQIGKVENRDGMVSFEDTDIRVGQTCFYMVLKCIDGAKVDESEKVYCTPILLAPKMKSVVGMGSNSAKVTWGQVEWASGYYVYRSNSSGSGFSKIATVDADTTSYTDNSLINGKPYYYRIKAYTDEEAVATSKNSDWGAYYMKPVAPVAKGEFQKDKIRVSWTRPTGGETFYVYRSVEGGSYTKIATTTGLSYYDADVKIGKTYSYKVTTSYSRDGKTLTSDYSGAISVYASGVDPNKPMVALTFDDGPGRYTQSIVDCLKKYNARATFFVIGQQVNSYKSAMKAAFDAGCQIGNHSWSHPQLSSSNVTKQIGDTDAAVKKVIGQNTKIYRAPYGYTNSTIRSKVSKPHIYWSIDTWDWKTKSKSATIDHVLKNVRDGDIILMHDIHKPTMEAALYLIPELQRRGYQLVTVSELAEYKGTKMKNGVTYYSFR